MRSKTAAPRSAGKRAAAHRVAPARAVIDLGSNSGRVVVVREMEPGVLEIVADGRAPLRLAKDLNRSGTLSTEAIERTISAVRDFHRLTLGAGVKRPRVIATSAIREAANAREIVQAIRAATGLRVEILSGEEEAAYAFRGAIQGLPIESGYMFDLGGGSLEITRFARRRLIDSWTLPLGSLRLSDRFLKSDPPTARQVQRLRKHVDDALRALRLPKLEDDGQLIATGGSVRNLAKIDRRDRNYPLERLHGYALPLARLRSIVTRITPHKLGARAAIPGLNADRADSIVGGAICLEVAMERIGAKTLWVSGQGTREGVLYSSSQPLAPATRVVRDTAFLATLRRFASWDERQARRRAEWALVLCRRIFPAASPELRETLRLGALALDVGRSVDYYNRHRHAGWILRNADLAGLTAREVSLLSALVTLSGDEPVSFELERPLLGTSDSVPVRQAAVVLAIADAITDRCPPNATAKVRVRQTARAVWLSSPTLEAWRPRDLAVSFERAFGRKLRIGR
ncbi:MAG: Ppx/GppA family phosphatase [Candidatus Eisenbacteria bacterium]|nr:Ppx/GppA family phosphatase [Candidatus Eisenbacteria bacterium]